MTKYVTQGERDMVTAIVSDLDLQTGVEGIEMGASSSCFFIKPTGRIPYEVCAASSLSDPWGDAVFIFRSREDESSAAASWRFAGPLYVDGGPNGSDQGHRVASRDWVESRMDTVHMGVVSPHHLNVGGVAFTQIGGGVYEFTQTNKFVASFYPRTTTSNLPSPWCHIQLRHTGFDSDSNQIMQVRCMQDNGEPRGFAVVVHNPHT